MRSIRATVIPDKSPSKSWPTRAPPPSRPLFNTRQAMWAQRQLKIVQRAHQTRLTPYSTNIQRTIPAERTTRQRDLKRCPPSIVWSAFKTILGSSGTESVANYPVDLVSPTNYNQRKGTSNFVNRKRAITVIETAEIENERQKLLLKIFQKVKDIEDEKQGLTNTNSSQTSSTNRSSVSGQPGFFS